MITTTALTHTKHQDLDCHARMTFCKLRAWSCAESIKSRDKMHSFFRVSTESLPDSHRFGRKASDDLSLSLLKELRNQTDQDRFYVVVASSTFQETSKSRERMVRVTRPSSKGRTGRMGIPLTSFVQRQIFAFALLGLVGLSISLYLFVGRAEVRNNVWVEI